jgi:FkbM family methyltransferase
MVVLYSASDEFGPCVKAAGYYQAMNIISTNVRGIVLRLVGYTRALELCARMNRETEILDFIDSMEPGDVLYDIGACEGRFALYAASRGIRCVAFEPEELNFQALTENIELNRDTVGSLLTPMKFAVGERNHNSTIKIAQPWAGGHQRVVVEAARVDLNLNFASEQTIKVISVDEFIRAQNVPPPKYLKIDIDGSELLFIRGAKGTLHDPNLRAIMFELQVKDKNYKQIIELLGSCGLTVKNQYEVAPHLFNVWFTRKNKVGRNSTTPL